MANRHTTPTSAADNPDVRHEETDVNIRGIFAFAFGLVVVAAVIHLVVWLLFAYFSTRETARVAPRYPLAATEQNRLPPEPRLQTNPRQDLADLRAAEERILSSYGWVDRNAGIVRIPIEEAMRLVVERGLPARQTEQQ